MEVPDTLGGIIPNPISGLPLTMSHVNPLFGVSVRLRSKHIHGGFLPPDLLTSSVGL
jgi:hypothetical protein